MKHETSVPPIAPGKHRVDIGTVVFDDDGKWGVMIRIVRDGYDHAVTTFKPDAARQTAENLLKLADQADEMNEREKVLQ